MKTKKNDATKRNPPHADHSNGQADTLRVENIAPLADEANRIRLITAEPLDAIAVGGGGKLVVPREDVLADLDDGTELDLVNAQPKKVRKPDRHEWIVLHRGSELPTRLLLHKPKADGIEVEHYHVDPKLRAPILNELKDVRAFVYYSPKSKNFSLWVINVTPDNTWYESLNHLLKQPAEFFRQYSILVKSDKANARYQVKFKPFPGTVAWPDKETGELLGEALGPERFITMPDHPIYQDLIGGTELT